MRDRYLVLFVHASCRKSSWRTELHHAAFYLESDTNHRLSQCLIDIEVSFVFRQVAFAMRLVEHPPLFVGQFERVREALKNHVTAFGSIAVPT